MLTADYERLGLRAGETMLDLGCGFGRHSYEALRRGANIVACDLGLDELNGVIAIAHSMREEGLITDEPMTETTQGDATCLPFNDESFERVIASEVLEHIPDDEAALAELARVLKPGGHFLSKTFQGGTEADLLSLLKQNFKQIYHVKPPASRDGSVELYLLAKGRK